MGSGKSFNGLALAIIASAAMSYGAEYTWNGDAGDEDWLNSGNWQGGAVPASLSAAGGADDPDTIFFDGDHMPTNHAAFGGNHANDSASMTFNSGGEFTLDLSTSFDSSPCSEVDRSWLTVGDGVGGGADVTVNLENMRVTLRHGSVACTNVVNADGVLNVLGGLAPYTGDRGAGFVLNGGTMVVSGVVSAVFSAHPESTIYFAEAGSSFTATYGGAYSDFSMVTDDQANNFIKASDLTFEYATSENTFTVRAVQSPVVAVFDASVESGIAPLAVDFDGSASYPSGDVVSYLWNFGDGITATGSTVSHTYDTGVYMAALTVVDAFGSSNTATLAISAGAPAEGIEIAGDPSGSSVAAHGTSLFNLTSDPFTYDPQSPTAVLPSLLYSDGFHGNEVDGGDVILNFMLNESYTTSAEFPVIAMDIWGRNSNQNRDDDLDVILYNGDYETVVGWVEGIAVADGTEPYARALIKVMAIGTTFDRVQIVGHNSASTAANAFTLTEVRLAAVFGELNTLTVQMTASPTNGVPGLEVDFDASASIVHNLPATYHWDFGDGNTDNGETVSHTYPDEGSYTATLTVVDAVSATGTATTVISVFNEINAVMVVSTNSVTVPGEVVFDGTESTAQNGIASYEWDFGDGFTDSGEFVTHTYETGGVFTAMLTVIDTLGSSNSVTTEIEAWYMPEFVEYTTEKYDLALPPAVSAVDLGQTAFLSVTNTGVWADDRSDDDVDLFNGTTTNETWLHTDASVTITFDTSLHGQGYDIMGIDTVFGSSSGANGRANQGYSVLVTYMDGSTEKILGKKTWEPNSPAQYWTKVSFTNTVGGVIASGVKAVTFAEFDPANAASYGDFSIAREFDIFGVPSIDLSVRPMLREEDGFLVWDTPVEWNYEVESSESVQYPVWTTYMNVLSTPPETRVALPLGRSSAEFFRVIYQSE